MQTFPLNSNKTPAVSGWQKFTGSVTSPMFGVSPPEGFYVIDVDSYKDDSVKGKIEQVLGCCIDWERSHIQTTLNGGSHHAFIIPHNVHMLQGSDILGVKGFDTRASGRGYIASGEGYTVIDADIVTDRFDDFLPELPASAFEKLSTKAETTKAVALDVDSKMYRNASIEVLNDDETKLTPKQIKKILSNLPQEVGQDNDSWQRVCAGLKRQLLAMGKTEDELNTRDSWGYKVLAAWSAVRVDEAKIKGNKTLEQLVSEYDAQNFNRWCSYGLDDNGNQDGKLVTFASVVSLAGGIPRETKVVINPDTLQAETVDVDDHFYTHYVMEGGTGRYINKDTKQEYNAKGFDMEHALDTPVNNSGTPIKPTAHVHGKLEVVSDVIYTPNFKQVFIAEHNKRKYLNLYMEPTHRKRIRPQNEAVQVVKDHLEHLLDDPKERELIFYFLAHNIQYPGKKIPWGIILQGTPGDGKSFFSLLMRDVMGVDNVRIMNADTLQSTFSGWAAGQCMVFIEELKLDNYKKYEIVNRLKPYISNIMIEWTRKGKDPASVPNTSNYFCFTNHKDAIPIDDTDRRYAVFFSKWQGDSIDKFVNDNPDYYPDLYNYMFENISDIYHDFMEVKIPNWFLALQRAPVTDAKRHMIKLTKPVAQIDVELAVADFSDKVLLDEGETLNVTLLSKQGIAERMAENDDSMYANFPDPVSESLKLSRTLTAMGWHKVDARRKINGSRCTVYSRNQQ